MAFLHSLAFILSMLYNNNYNKLFSSCQESPRKSCKYKRIHPLNPFSWGVLTGKQWKRISFPHFTTISLTVIVVRFACWGHPKPWANFATLICRTCLTARLYAPVGCMFFILIHFVHHQYFTSLNLS